MINYVNSLIIKLKLVVHSSFYILIILFLINIFTVMISLTNIFRIESQFNILFSFGLLALNNNYLTLSRIDNSLWLFL